MEQNKRTIRSLAEVEAEVLAEGREWTRRRLEQRLQELADQNGEVFPPQPEHGGGAAPASDATADAGWLRGAGGMVRKKRSRR